MPKQTSDIVIGGNICAIFKGKPGTRKTCGAASFPGPIYFFDFDGRMAPVKKMFPNRSDVFYDTYLPKEFKSANEMWDKLMNGLLKERYKTVVLDSLTTFADGVLDFARSLRAGDGTKGSGKADAGGIIPMSDISDFNIESSGLTQLMYRLKELSARQNCHVIATAHVIEVQQTDVISKVQTVNRSLLTAGKKIAEKFPAVFDEVWHFETRSPASNASPECWIRTDNGGIDFAKTALPLPLEINFTGKSLFEEVKKECEKKGVKLG